MKVGIYVLNYNGRDMLKLCLPSIVEAAEQADHDCTITVVDNLSSDGSESLVRTCFPDVEFLVMRSNRVLCSFNDVAQVSDDDVMILLNNDIKVDPDFVNPLISVFEAQKDVFLSAPCCMSFDGKSLDGSKTIPIFRWGLLKGVPAPEGEKIGATTYTLQCGFGAFDRRKFLELNGYDDMYLPGIIEDTDLCFRAWRQGYACYYEPRSIVYHMGRASFKKVFGIRKLLAISHRNTYLFSWKHIHVTGVLAKHILCIPPRLLYSIIVFKPEIFWGLFWAILKLPGALSRRKVERAVPYMYSMKEVLDKISSQKQGSH